MCCIAQGVAKSQTRQRLDNCGTLFGKRQGWSVLTPSCPAPEPLIFTFIILSLPLILVLNEKYEKWHLRASVLLICSILSSSLHLGQLRLPALAALPAIITSHKNI